MIFLGVLPYRNDEEVEVRNPPELLEQVDEPEGEEGVLRARDLIVAELNLGYHMLTSTYS